MTIRKKLSSVEVALEWPVTVAGAKYETLTMRRMKARDTLVAEGEGDASKAAFMLMAELAGVDIEVILELDAADLETVIEKAAPLMGKSGAAMLEAQAESPSAGATS